MCDFNNVLFTCPRISPTIACWPILTPFERHLQSVTVLDNERDLPIVCSFQAIFSMKLNGFQMEELARGRRQSKLLFLSDFAKVSLFSLRIVQFYRRWQTFWQVQYALNCCVQIILLSWVFPAEWYILGCWYAYCLLFISWDEAFLLAYPPPLSFGPLHTCHPPTWEGSSWCRKLSPNLPHPFFPLKMQITPCIVFSLLFKKKKEKRKKLLRDLQNRVVHQRQWLAELKS